MAPLNALAMALEPDNGSHVEASALNAGDGELGAVEVVAGASDEIFPDSIALESTFGA